MKTTAQIAFSSLALILTSGVASAAPAADNWENLCASCHGADGKGQTKSGKKLKLRDYTDPKVQAEMKDEDMCKAIADGVKVEGKEKMKPFKDEITAEEIKDLVAYIRQLKA